MKNVTLESDIVVIGAGPCGSFSALAAAKLGAEVIIFEEHSNVGVPSHCAGHLSLSGLRRLGLKLPSSVVENLFKSASFFSPSGTQFSVRFPSPVTCVVNRELFDRHLADAAASTGSRYFLDSRVESLVLERSGVKGITISNDKGAEKFHSQLVIDAEGVSSKFLKNVGLKPFDRRMLVKAVSAEVDNVRDVEPDGVEVYFGNAFADGFYAWVIPKRDGTAKIGLATSRGNPKKCLEHFIHKHKIARYKLGKTRILRLSYHAIPLGGPISKTYADGFLAVGDVASQVKPTTGGGVIMGLTCAQVAGEVAAHAVEADDFSGGLLRVYEARWRQKIEFDMKAMLFARKLLNRLSDREIDKLFNIAAKLRLNETLAHVKDVDFQGNALLRIVKSPSAVATLAYLFFSVFT